MAQKVYDQAELVFEKLARSQELDVVVRAEFLRGVLAFRRGDRDEARDIFRGVLERVPNVELANQALFNLAEVYGAEERYIDQLEFAPHGRPLGPGEQAPARAGHAAVDRRARQRPGHQPRPQPHSGQRHHRARRRSKKRSISSAAAPARVCSAPISKRASARPTKDDKVLQLTGKDVDQVRLSRRVQGRVQERAAVRRGNPRRRRRQVRNRQQQDRRRRSKKRSASNSSAKPASRRTADKRVSQSRPANQIKPGNPIYLRVKDADRDLSRRGRQVVVKLTADSGDQVQVRAARKPARTPASSKGTAKTGELPAGALASDTAIDHSPLMAIDQDPKTFWLSEPDGATPKWLAVDMKDLRKVARVRIATPDATKQSPVRGELLGSQDGRFWFRIASHPERPPRCRWPANTAR